MVNCLKFYSHFFFCLKKIFLLILWEFHTLYFVPIYSTPLLTLPPHRSTSHLASPQHSVRPPFLIFNNPLNLICTFLTLLTVGPSIHCSMVQLLKATPLKEMGFPCLRSHQLFTASQLRVGVPWGPPHSCWLAGSCENLVQATGPAVTLCGQHFHTRRQSSSQVFPDICS